MHPSVIPYTDSFSSQTADSPGPNLVIIYENLSAALWATDTVMNLFRKITDCPIPRLSAWSFPSLDNLGSRCRATRDALSADLLVIAASSAHRHLPAFLEEWIGSCLATPGRSQCAIAALLRRASIPDGADSPRLQSLQRLAHTNGCEFFAPFVKPPEPQVVPDSDAIASGSTPTPFTQKLFDARLAS